MAFEEVSGEDLHWFFDQWFQKKGHPEVNVNYEWDETSQNLKISVAQEPSNVWTFSGRRSHLLCRWQYTKTKN